MMQKIKSLPYRRYLKELRDVRTLGLLVFGVIVLLVSWSGIGVIQTNYELQKQQSKLEEQNKVQELENANQKLRNEYFKTDSYLELTARRQFGKALPDEKLVLVPKSVALAYTTDLSQTSTVVVPSVQPQKPAYQRNFESWLSFFFHRAQ